jgi:hypothetical protein
MGHAVADGCGSITCRDLNFPGTRPASHRWIAEAGAWPTHGLAGQRRRWTRPGTARRTRCNDLDDGGRATHRRHEHRHGRDSGAGDPSGARARPGVRHAPEYPMNQGVCLIRLVSSAIWL